jgi:hypothetical protein
MKTRSSTRLSQAPPRPGGVRFQGQLSPAAARSLLGFGFTEPDHLRIQELSAKARAGKLTADEQAELDMFERIGCVLDIIHSQARQALKKTSAPR